MQLKLDLHKVKKKQTKKKHDASTPASLLCTLEFRLISRWLDWLRQEDTVSKPLLLRRHTLIDTAIFVQVYKLSIRQVDVYLQAYTAI